MTTPQHPTIPDWQSVLDFWFLPAGHTQHGTVRSEWFKKDASFDADIHARFGGLVAQAVAGGLRGWDEAHGAPGTLARIILLDQFTRNTLRDTPGAFSGDALALAAAQGLVASGADRGLTHLQRWFAYMPFEHAEDLALQDLSVALFAKLNDEAGGTMAGVVDYAQRHREVISRFGRFPHRNRILGRESTPAEVDYLSTPGAGF